MMDSKKKYTYIFWLIWPLGALIWSIKNIRSEAAWTLIFLFCVFFGLTFIVPEDVIGAADAARYARELRQMHASPLSFEQFLNYLYNDNSNKVDVYQPFVTWLISQFTANPKWLFTFFAVVYGFFYVMNLKIVVQEIGGNTNTIIVLLLFLLALTIPIWNVNGVRMWTAAQVFLYGILKHFVQGNRKGMIWAILSIFVHFSFLFPVGILILFRLIPKRPLLIFVFYVLSFLVSEINVEQYRGYINSLPQVFENRVDAYTSEAALERFEDASLKKLSWHVTLARISQNYLMQFFLIITFNFYSKRKEAPAYFKELLSFTLLFSAFANVARLLPSGGRFVIIAHFLITVVLLIKVANLSFQPGLLRILKITMPLVLFLLVFKIREGTDFIGFLTIVGNPILAMVIDDQVPIIDFIKSLI